MVRSADLGLLPVGAQLSVEAGIHCNKCYDRTVNNAL